MLIEPQGFAILGSYVENPEEKTKAQKEEKGIGREEKTQSRCVAPALGSSLLVSRPDTHTFLPSAKRM